MFKFIVWNTLIWTWSGVSIDWLIDWLNSPLLFSYSQQLANEQSQRNVAESRVEKLEEILDTLRQMLSGKNGDRVLTDYEREQMERSTAEKIARLERHSSKVQ